MKVQTSEGLKVNTELVLLFLVPALFVLFSVFLVRRHFYRVKTDSASKVHEQ